jgi:hypothetical protein
MDGDYLANSLLIHIEGEIIRNYTYDDIVTDFKDLKERKSEFYQVLNGLLILVYANIVAYYVYNVPIINMYTLYH